MMKILIKKNSPIGVNTRLRARSTNKSYESWIHSMVLIQGSWIDVEEDHLFDDQFNTPPIPGGSKDGLRVMDCDVERVYMDKRHWLGKCGWCGAIDHKYMTCCPNCRETKYWKPFDLRRYRYMKW